MVRVDNSAKILSGRLWRLGKPWGAIALQAVGLSLLMNRSDLNNCIFFLFPCRCSLCDLHSKPNAAMYNSTSTIWYTELMPPFNQYPGGLSLCDTLVHFGSSTASLI
jgi:hypothetical protein